MPAELTWRQKVMLDFIVKYVDEHGYAPCMREICQHALISSTSVVKYNLRNLASMELLEMTEGIARGVRVTDKGRLAAYSLVTK